MNSEFKHESWYIENPISRELTKRITLKLGPKAEQEFIIVVRSPTNNVRRIENMLSIINIGLLTYADEEFGGRDSFEDLLKSRYNNSMKEFLRDRKIATESPDIAQVVRAWEQQAGQEKNVIRKDMWRELVAMNVNLN